MTSEWLMVMTEGEIDIGIIRHTNRCLCGADHYIINICHPGMAPLISTHGSSGTIMGSFVEKIIQNYTKGWMFELLS